MLPSGPATTGTIDVEHYVAPGAGPFDERACDELVRALSGYDAVWTVEVLPGDDVQPRVQCISGRCAAVVASRGWLGALAPCGGQMAVRRANLVRLLADLQRAHFFGRS